MIIDEYEEPTLGNKIMKVIVGIFLTILVSMLILTLLPGDAEQNMFKLLTGQDNYSAGKIGDESISPDYFQAARKDCYQRYKDYNPNFANDASEINSCAYDMVKSFKVYQVLSKSVGFGYSENKIKEGIWEQAKIAHKESYLGAGYSDEDRLKPEEIYKNILRSTPMGYRMDYMVAMGFDRFLMSNLKNTPSEDQIERDSSSAKLSFSYIVLNDADLLSKIGDNLPVSDDEIKQDYEKSLKEGNIPKSPDGKTPSLEERKSLIENKIRVEKKQIALTDLKTKILNIKNQNGKISEIGQLSGSQLIEIRDLPLTSASKTSENKSLSFMGSNAFLRDLGEVAFGSGKISGPYPDGEKSIYVEFKELKIENGTKLDEKKEDRYSNIPVFLMEISNSMKSIYPVYRKFDKQEN